MRGAYKKKKEEEGHMPSSIAGSKSRVAKPRVRKIGEGI